MQEKSPNLSFGPSDDEPRPCGPRRPASTRVVVSIAKKQYEGEWFAAVRFGARADWVRGWFDGLILPTPQATLLPFADVGDFTEVLNDQDLEVVVERRVWEMFKMSA